MPKQKDNKSKKNDKIKHRYNTRNKKKAEMDPDSSDSDEEFDCEDQPEMNEKEFKTLLSQMFPSKYMNNALAKLEKEEKLNMRKI